jgi:hypothetical protein
VSRSPAGTGCDLVFLLLLLLLLLLKETWKEKEVEKAAAWC